VNVGTLFVPNAQAPEMIQPSEGPLHDPAPSPQSAAMLGIALGQLRQNMSVTQLLTDCAS
jgi:hypothetical protein